MPDRDYCTPAGKRMWYARPPFTLRQHLCEPVLGPQVTLCGHPVADWCNLPMRTPVGMTCWWCRWRVRRGGTVRVAPLAYPWWVVVQALRAYERLTAWWRRRREGE